MNSMDDNNNSSGNGFFTGFLIGAAIGAGAVFLLKTESGKKLVKTITDSGMEGLSEIGDMLEDEVEEFSNKPIVEKKVAPVKSSKPLASKKEEIVTPEPLEAAETAEEVMEETTHASHTNGHSHKSPMLKLSHSTKRFFKGIPKKS